MTFSDFVRVAARSVCSVLLASTLPASCSPSAPVDHERTRMTFQVDYAAALTEKRITKPDSNAFEQLSARIVTVLEKRLDPDAKLGVDVFARDVETIVVEAPSSMEAPDTAVEMPTMQEVAPNALTIPLGAGKDGATTIFDFPDTGGEVEIDGEHIRYANRQSNGLCELTRGLHGTKVTDHAAGAVVRLRRGDTLRRRVERMGEFRLLQVYEDGKTAAPAVDFHAERARFDAWIRKDTGAPLTTFNRASADEGGPTALQWVPTQAPRGGKPSAPESRALPLVVPPAAWRFTEADIVRATLDPDSKGDPAVHIAFDPKRADAFGAFTESAIGGKLAVVIDDEIFTAPVVRTKLPPSMILEGSAIGGSKARAEALANELNAGVLPAPLRFRLRESIDPKH